MGCDKIQNQLSAYIDNELSDQERIDVEQHVTECEECLRAYEEMKTIVAGLQKLAQIELPEGFHGEFMEKLRMQTTNKTIGKKRIQLPEYRLPRSIQQAGLVAASIVALLFMVSSVLVLFTPAKTSQTPTPLFSASSAATAEEAGMISSIAVPEAAGATEAIEDSFESMMVQEKQSVALDTAGQIDVGTSAAAAGTQRKAVVNHSLSIKVEDLQLAIEQITASPAFVKSSEINYYANSKTEGNATFRLSVNSAEANSYLEYIKSFGDTLSENENQTQKTGEYYELQARIAAAETELERLNQLIANSQSLTTMIYIENRISEVSWQLDDYKGRLYYIENTTNAPEIYVSFYTEREYIQPIVTLHSRVQEGFEDSAGFLLGFFQGIVIFVASAFIPFMLLAMVIIVFFALTKLFRKRGDSK